MKFKKENTDFIFFAIIGLIIISSIYTVLVTNYVLSVNTIIGIVCWVAALILRIVKKRPGRYALGWLFILSSLNIINFTVFRFFISFGFGLKNDPYGLSPFMVLIMLFFYLVNKKSINRILFIFFKGSEDEQLEKRDKLVSFYFTKFETLPETELAKIYSDIDNYPSEAQIALKQLRAARSTAL